MKLLSRRIASVSDRLTPITDSVVRLEKSGAAPEPFQDCADRLQPLKANDRALLLAFLRDGGTGASPPTARKLDHLRWERSVYDIVTEAAVRFGAGSATIRVGGAETPPHVHQRLLDLVPFLDAAAPRVTHRGEVRFRLHDAGADRHISFSGSGDALLFPDCSFWSTAAYGAARRWYDRSLPWNARKPIALWRGSTTGSMSVDWRDLQRAKLCLAARDAPSESGLDAGFTEVMQLDDLAREQIIAAGLMRQRVEPFRYGDYRYHIDVDGNTNAWSALFYKLLSGGLVFKVGSPGGNRQWYYPRMQAWRHYVPVDASLGDLEEKLSWARMHDDRAQAIASSGRRFAESLTLVSEADFGLAVLEADLSTRAAQPIESLP